MAVKIIGTGSYVPKNVADNHFSFHDRGYE